jgi:hypothetical protein
MAKTLTDYIIEKASQNRDDAKSQDRKKSQNARKGGNASLTDFLLNSKNREKSRSRGGTSSTLTAALFERVARKKEKEQKEQTQKQVSFQEELTNTFKILSRKTEDIKVKVYELGKVLSDVTEQEMIMSQNMTVLSQLFSQRSMLEKAVFTAIAHKVSDFPKIEVQEAKKPPQAESPEESYDSEEDSPTIATSNQQTPTTVNPPTSPDKKAEGGIQPGVSNTVLKKDKVQSLVPYADTMQLTLQTSGIASINLIGEFISKSGALGGFFKPYVRSIIKPFALAMGVGESLFNTLLGSPVNAAEREKNVAMRDFGKTWGKILNDKDFVKRFIDREGLQASEEDDDPYTGEWGPLLDLIKSVEAVTHKYNAVNYGNGSGVIEGLTEMTISEAYRASEKYRSQYGGSGAVGQYQFMTPINQAKDAGLNPDSDKFSPANQDKMAIWIIENKRQGNDWKQRKISDDAFMKLVAAEWRGLPAGPDGKTYQDEYAGQNAAHATWDKYKQAIDKVKNKSFSRGGIAPEAMTPMSPFIVSGPESGFDFTVHDDIGRPYPLTLHGTELLDPMDSGVKIYPIQNRSFDIEKDPLALSKRWRDIAYNTGEKSTASYSAGGSADFWKIAAISAKEDTLHSQGQSDVAQTLYNRVAIGSYPGGKDIGSIITAEGQYQPTFGNAMKWKAIRDRKSAIAAVGSSKLIDMAATSISHPTLQREAAKFVAGRTDFQGESQKPYMKPGDVTRGKNHNFFGWFYDAKLPKPAPVPKSVSSQTRVTATSNKPTPQVVVNQVGSGTAKPSVVSKTTKKQQTVAYSFDPLKFIRELTMRRSR